ncbi:alpha/beta fold hydrolase [Alphaproteobacteria bacterium GH1-50]|uniref:Alpha/beta fold hydrolase n=1 Tax=Kangsaoukella pontilimi TaxID=2691042 RepID=A0A7C9MFT0_9RHOB|nr:alpha/beta hydrolase [Kangsaoukella pontilimi]MXQ09072.1 alpha/beta fold hydrolase [Kangsaoukella pontilimi]
MEAAPFDHALSEGPADLTVGWTTAADGVRLRYGLWQAEDAKGTILLFNGRTEYLEKYGRVIGHLTGAGYNVASIDWRGQGRSDRLLPDTRLGYIKNFQHYQKDVAALLAEVDTAGLGGPRFLVAHSMGGAIGLRALLDGLQVERAVFSAPMWGIYAKPHFKALVLTMLFCARRFRQTHRNLPGTPLQGHVLAYAFEENPLTTDAEQYAYMRRQSASDPALSLGSPTYQWLGEALDEIAQLHTAQKPPVPTRVMIGTEDKTVSGNEVAALVAGWPEAELSVFEGGKHELMFEVPALRDRFLSEALAFFAES